MDKIIKLVNLSINKVYEKQYYLIENEVHERSIVFWFGIYFYEILKNSDLKDYDLDFEYNKNFQDKKTTKNFHNGTFPDIILHKRGSNKHNLLIIEFKTKWKQHKGFFERDKRKLRDFINPNSEYKYRYALFVVFEKDEYKIEVIN